ncbi:MAG: hypothetical protein J6O61_03700 [Butyrivibrio sp.]|uniref:DUF6044 family protein n=1 Tax=Butyrivibrio sp. TaxID=28121 RepID=UPI001B161638|nr:DUF6044 family protein [Butyrivibrio sp.]MBO6239932.1 hypothetical protein [Butyrivibrio sp.]
MKKIKNNWYWGVVVFISILELIVFMIAGSDNTIIGVHDNLDIHIADYQILSLNKAFFGHNITVPLLGGIDRNFLLSEFYLYSVLYMIFPNFVAYIIGYFIKTFLALFSGILLGRDILKEKYKDYEWAIVLGSFIYGLLPLYPAFSFAFASIPLLIYLLRKAVEKNELKYYILLFLYPTLSYFTFFGPFIIGYIFIYFIYISIKDKRINIPLILSMILISISFILIEYRLFLLIFATKEPTIRDQMVIDNLSFSQIILTVKDVFINNMFHCNDHHRFVVMPIVLLCFVIINIRHILNREYKKLLSDPFNLVLYFIIFNCIIYGLYYCYPVRTLFETIFPPLKGWQFNRTVFFNPFLWYLEIIIVAIRMSRLYKVLPKIMLIIVMFMVIGTQSLYNDFYNTVYVNTWELINNEKSETISYGDFFSESLFDEIKKDIDYNGEYSVAYGFHPSVLSYSGISTLDGCLSYYYQSYKDAFRKVIAPALDESEVAREYYDEWGARAYIYSGTVDSIWSPTRSKDVDDKRLLIDTNAFKSLNGKYIFSRIEISNAKELGLKLVGQYQNEKSPYTIWLYSI